MLIMLLSLVAKYFSILSFCSQATLSPGYVLWQDLRSNGTSFSVPASLTDIEELRKAAEEFPAQERPEVYGLHCNADLTCRSMQVSRLCLRLPDYQYIYPSLSQHKVLPETCLAYAPSRNADKQVQSCLETMSSTVSSSNASSLAGVSQGSLASTIQLLLLQVRRFVVSACPAVIST